MAEGDILCEEIISDLLHVKVGGNYRGWKPDIFLDYLNLPSEKFLFCATCGGVMCDPCEFINRGVTQTRCSSCIPDDVRKLPSQTKDIIYEKLVRCPLEDILHVTICPLKHLMEHIKKCDHIPQSCPFCCFGKEAHIPKIHMTEHLNTCYALDIQCTMCHQRINKFHLDEHYTLAHGGREEPETKKCEFCDKTMPLGELPAHLEKCSRDTPLLLVECPFAKFGCREEVEESKMALHEREQIHSHLWLTTQTTARLQAERAKKIQELETELEQRSLEILKIETNLSKMVFSGRIIWEIDEVRQKIETKANSLSDTFNVGLYLCQGRIVWSTPHDHIGCYLCLLEGHWDNSLSWPFQYTLKVILHSSSPAHIWTRTICNEDLMTVPGCFKKPVIRNPGFGNPKFVSSWKFVNIDSIKIEFQVIRINI